MKNVPCLVLALTTLLLMLTRPGVAADDAAKLADVLIPGEDWQVAVDDVGFADGASCDAAGNFYFSDLKSKPAMIYRVTPDGTKTKVAEGSMSGTKIGPDGRLYGCGGGKVAAYDLATGKQTVLAEKDVQPNDLAVGSRGLVYFTETGKKQITLLDPKTGKVRPADTGTVNKPNGIALTPDQNTLLVSDYGGTHVWAFTIGADGSLSDKKPLMTLRTPDGKPDVAGGDGMTVDADGRAYVTSAIGLQVFDRAGELLGVLPKPQNGALTNVAFAGKDLSTMYVTCGNKVFKRKTKAKGALVFEAPGAAHPHAEVGEKK